MPSVRQCINPVSHSRDLFGCHCDLQKFPIQIMPSPPVLRAEQLHLSDTSWCQLQLYFIPLYFCELYPKANPLKKNQNPIRIQCCLVCFIFRASSNPPKFCEVKRKVKYDSTKLCMDVCPYSM